MNKQIMDNEFREYENHYVQQIISSQTGRGLPYFKEYQKGGFMPLSVPLAMYLASRSPQMNKIILGQRGDGFGSFFKGLFRMFLPVVKKVGKSLGKQAIHTGIDIVRDVAHGHNIKDAASQRLSEAENQVLNKTKERVDKIMTGSGRKKMIGRGRKKINKKVAFQKKLFSLIGPPKKTTLKRRKVSSAKRRQATKNKIDKWI